MAAIRTPELTLRPASPGDGVDVWAMIREIGPGENGFHNDGFDVPLSRFPAFLAKLEDMRHGRALPSGYVPQTTFWVYADEHPVGISKLRHRLTDALRRTGGHIGYCIRPTERRKRYGNAMLRATLVEARELGITEALITVNVDNAPSWRMIEANGGVLGKIEDGKRYYTVATSDIATGDIATGGCSNATSKD